MLSFQKETRHLDRTVWALGWDCSNWLALRLATQLGKHKKSLRCQLVLFLHPPRPLKRRMWVNKAVLPSRHILYKRTNGHDHISQQPTALPKRFLLLFDFCTARTSSSSPSTALLASVGLPRVGPMSCTMFYLSIISTSPWTQHSLPLKQF